MQVEKMMRELHIASQRLDKINSPDIKEEMMSFLKKMFLKMDARIDYTPNEDHLFILVANEFYFLVHAAYEYGFAVDLSIELYEFTDFGSWTPRGFRWLNKLKHIACLSGIDDIDVEKVEFVKKTAHASR